MPIIVLVLFAFSVVPFLLFIWWRIAFWIYIFGFGGLLTYSWIDQLISHPNAWMEHDGGFRVSLGELFTLPFVLGVGAAFLFVALYKRYKKRKHE